MNKYKQQCAIDTDKRSLDDAFVGADIAIGLSSPRAFTRSMIKSMNDNPAIFALHNPEPEITPDEVYEVRDDAIIATGRSDYPNQINSAMCFPFLFRGALDVRAKTFNDEMKLACAINLATLARRPVPAVVKHAYDGVDVEYGREYLVPSIFDPRLLTEIPMEVAISATRTGVARNFISDWTSYKYQLQAKISRTHI